MFRPGAVCEDGPSLVEEIVELHSSIGVRKHCGDVAQAAATRGLRPNGFSPPLRGDRGPLGLSLHTNQVWVVITTLSCAAGTNQSATTGEFVLLRRAMPRLLLVGFALFCFRAQLKLSLSRFQARQQDSSALGCDPLRPIRTTKQLMDASYANAVLLFIGESRVVSWGRSRVSIIP